MPKRSAGLLLYRPATAADGSPTIEVLLVHPGGPYWARRDDGWWSIPKGEIAEGEDGLEAAEREFSEELGVPVPPGPRLPLGEVVQASAKHVLAWAVEGDLDVSALDGDTFELEWPPRSGTLRTFPEVDRAAWFTPGEARVKLLPAQRPLLDRLTEVAGRRA